MTHRMLTGTTALTLCLALTMSGAAMAQSKTLCTDTDDQACENGYDRSGLAKVMASLAANKTPTAGQIEQLNKGDLMKLIKERDLDIDPRGMPPTELRAAVKADLGIDARVEADADQASRGKPDEAQNGMVENLGQALTGGEEDQQAQAKADAQGQVAAEASNGNRKQLTRQEIDGMDRKALSKVIRRRGLAIEAQGMQTADLRVAVSQELGLMQRPEQTDDTLGGALKDATEGAVDMNTAEREAELDRRRAEEYADADTPLAAATNAETQSDSDVTTRTVTEETSRSSNEEFETQLMTGAEATTGAQVQDNDDDGLSNLEKAAVLGLGALALNEILGANDEIVTSSSDRVVVRQDGELRILKNDDIHLQRPGNEVQTRAFSDGSMRTVITRADGSKVITIRAADGRVLRRVRERADGTRVVIFDDTQYEYEPVVVSELPEPQERGVTYSSRDRVALEEALNANLSSDVERHFSLRQVRDIRAVRKLMPPVTLDAVNFRTDSAVIRQREAEDLGGLGKQLAEAIDQNPGEVFLVEGHTDTVGSASYNLALSDRRAESVALALIEYFDVPSENLVIQGYGESDLVVPTQGAERANRRVTVRRITPLLRSQAR